ncbi:MAG: Gfo/Idh/MocA family oxidoreductase [Acidobacteriota bacterium]
MVNVALLGLGYWGPNLLRNLVALETVKVTALCDLNVQRAAIFQRRFCADARIIGDYRLLADDPQVDAVVVATPIRTHYEVGSFLLASGKHVLIEKPLARTEDECRKLIAMAEHHRRVLMVGHVFEYNVAVRRIKQYINGGDLGRLFYVYSQRVNLGRIQHDINALWSFAPHDISILNYWFDEQPSRVSARGFSYLNSGIEDVVFATLEYPNGIGAHLHLGWLDPRKARLMTLVGSKKMLIYDDVSLDGKIQIYDKGIAGLHDFLETPESFAEFQFQLRVGDLVIPTMQFGEPLQSECQHFIDCIEHERQPLSDGLSGLRVVRVLEAAQRSLRQDGKPIELALE